MFRVTVAFLAILALALSLFTIFRPTNPPVCPEPPTTTVAATTAAPATTLPTTITTTPAATTTATTTTTAPTPITISVTVAALRAAFDNATYRVVQETNAFNAATPPVAQPRTFTGVAIRDILENEGIVLADIPTTATLTVTPDSGNPATVSYANFMAPTTILAWYEYNRNTSVNNVLLRPRLVFGDTSSALWGAFTQQIVSITLNF